MVSRSAQQKPYGPAVLQPEEKAAGAEACAVVWEASLAATGAKIEPFNLDEERKRKAAEAAMRHLNRESGAE